MLLCFSQDDYCLYRVISTTVESVGNRNSLRVSLTVLLLIRLLTHEDHLLLLLRLQTKKSTLKITLHLPFLSFQSFCFFITQPPFCLFLSCNRKEKIKKERITHYTPFLFTNSSSSILSKVRENCSFQKIKQRKHKALQQFNHLNLHPL